MDRVSALEKLLQELKKVKGDNNSSDIELILEYLEEYIDNGVIKQSQWVGERIMKFTVENNVATLSKNYGIAWKKPDSLLEERYGNK